MGFVKQVAQIITPCWYGARLLTRAHQLPFFDKDKLCPLVDKPIPYRHGVRVLPPKYELANWAFFDWQSGQEV